MFRGLGVVGGEGVVGAPVGGGGHSVKQPGGSEQKCAGAYRCCPRGVRVGPADPVDDRVPVCCVLARDPVCSAQLTISAPGR